MRAADVLSQVCVDLCRKEPDLGLMFRRLASQLNKDLGKARTKED